MKSARTKKKTNAVTGPGKILVTLYADKAELPLYKARAASLGLSLSRYLWSLAKRDSLSGGDFTLTPKDAGAAHKK